MIPQSELDRIEKEAAIVVDPMFRLAWMQGAKHEYLRSASRMEELLQAAREVVKQYDGCHANINEYQDVCFKMEEMNRFESALEKLEVAISTICRPQP